MLTSCTSAVNTKAVTSNNPDLAVGQELKTTDSGAQMCIEVVAIRSSAAGYILDFRFRVIDLDRAMTFFREDIKPYVLDQKSGKSLSVPVPAKLGPMRPTGRDPKEGITYWMYFGNPGLISIVDKVTVVVGDYRLRNLTVE
jgi:hypothetical protein